MYHSSLPYNQSLEILLSNMSYQAIHKQIDLSIIDAVKLGFEYHQKGDLAMAETIYRQILKVDPNQVDCLHLLGMIAHKVYKHVDAEDLILKAIKLLPSAAEMHNNLGEVQRALGKLDQAVQSYRRAIALKKSYVDAFENLKKAIADSKQLEKANAEFKKMFRKNIPKHYSLLELGNTLMMKGNYQVALQAYQAAYAEKPGFQDARFGTANALSALDKTDSAISYYQEALKLEPKPHERIWANLGETYYKIGQFEKAIEIYDNALEIKPDFDVIQLRKGACFVGLMEMEKADACLDKALQSEVLNKDVIRVVKATSMPAIMGTSEDVAGIRQNMSDRLDVLLDSDIVLEDPYSQINATNFYLAFHGENDRAIQQKIAKVYEKASPSLGYTADHCKDYKFEGKSKIKIGFLSKFIYRHSVARCFGKIIEYISQCEDFDVTLFSVYDKEDEVTKKTYQHCKGGRVVLPGHVNAAREMIAELKLDVLIYLDIGMEPLSYFLAFSRLAPVQCVMNGHPDTTGIKNMDYYLSIDAFEPEDADSHYSEKLVRMKRESIFDRMIMPPVLKSREELGFPSDRRLYICPVKLQKIHPDFDVAISQILERDSDADVLFFDDHTYPVWQKKLQQRFDKTISPKVRDRVKFLPWISNTAGFLNVAACADVLLDSFHFGANSTSILLYATGVPLVTLPGKYNRGRNAMGYSRMMGIEEVIASDVDDYVAKAISFASEIEQRVTVGEKILANNHVLYEDRTAADEVEKFIRGCFNH